MYSVNETASVALEALNRVMNTPSSVRDTSYAVAKPQNAHHENAASINIVNMDMIEFLLCSILIFDIVLLVVGLLIMSGKRISLPKFSVSFSLTRCTNILRNCFRRQDQGLCIYFHDNSDRWVECKIDTRTNELLQSASAFKVEYGYFYPIITC